jgi:hypothetical protein
MLCLLEFHGQAFGKAYNYGGLERVNELGDKLKRLEKLGLARRVEVADGLLIDWDHLLVWRGERWAVSSQAFAWWVRDNVIVRTRHLPACEEWLQKKEYQ